MIRPMVFTPKISPLKALMVPQELGQLGMFRGLGLQCLGFFSGLGIQVLRRGHITLRVGLGFKLCISPKTQIKVHTRNCRGRLSKPRRSPPTLAVGEGWAPAAEDYRRPGGSGLAGLNPEKPPRKPSAQNPNPELLTQKHGA